MKFADFKNHRNQKYMNWLRSKRCIVSGKNAQCVHHIRLGTNGGTALKPSDYFCIPLTNEFHTTGATAVHKIGEETFLKHWDINIKHLFKVQLEAFLREEFNLKVKYSSDKFMTCIHELIKVIENMNTTKTTAKSKPSIRESEYYQAQKEKKREADKKLRKKLPKVSETEFYQTQKKLKQQLDQDIRDSLQKSSESEFYHKQKLLKKEAEKKMRDSLKKANSEYRKRKYQKLKELNKNRE